jgi:large subunit ribosomal protein L3
MALGLVGRKVGMTRVFQDDGISVPVTVIEVLPNKVTQIKNQDSDGYSALQVTTGAQKPHRITKPEAGIYAKAEIEPGQGFWEFRLEETELANFTLGAEITLDVLEEVSKVDVTGTSKGKGFAGGIKRHHFSSQRMTHGNSLSHRAPGSIGQNQTPGRVFKGKKMAGHLGDVRKSIQNLDVVRIDAERNLILVKGSVPGSKGSRVIVRPAVKQG